MKRKRILIVDSDAELLNELADRCRGIGLEVETAQSVLAAMAALDEGLPDLVCFDIDMPSDNGLTICEMMATDGLARRIPLIVLSNDKDHGKTPRCGSMCAYYVHKRAQIWNCIEPVIYELIDIQPSTVSPR